MQGFMKNQKISLLILFLCVQGFVQLCGSTPERSNKVYNQSQSSVVIQNSSGSGGGAAVASQTNNVLPVTKHINKRVLDIKREANKCIDTMKKQSNLRVDTNIAVAFMHSYYAQHHNFGVQSNNSQRCDNLRGDEETVVAMHSHRACYHNSGVQNQGHYVKYNHFAPIYHHTRYASAMTENAVVASRQNEESLRDDSSDVQFLIQEQQQKELEKQQEEESDWKEFNELINSTCDCSDQEHQQNAEQTRQSSFREGYTTFSFTHEDIVALLKQLGNKQINRSGGAASAVFIAADNTSINPADILKQLEQRENQ